MFHVTNHSFLYHDTHDDRSIIYVPIHFWKFIQGIRSILFCPYQNRTPFISLMMRRMMKIWRAKRMMIYHLKLHLILKKNMGALEEDSFSSLQSNLKVLEGNPKIPDENLQEIQVNRKKRIHQDLPTHLSKSWLHLPMSTSELKMTGRM